MEDNDDCALLLREVIETSGHELAGTAASVEEAVAAAALVPPDVALLDIGLRGSMIGIEGAQLLRSRFPAISIIFVTGYSDPMVVQATSFLRPVAYLVKPVAPEQVAAALAACEVEQRERPPRSSRREGTKT